MMEIKEGYAKDVTELLMLYGKLIELHGKLLEKHIDALVKPIYVVNDNDNDQKMLIK